MLQLHIWPHRLAKSAISSGDVSWGWPQVFPVRYPPSYIWHRAAEASDRQVCGCAAVLGLYQQAADTTKLHQLTLGSENQLQLL